MIAMGTTSVELPDSLKGDYTLYMFYGDIVYYGGINLYQKKKNDKVNVVYNRYDDMLALIRL